MKEKTPPLLTDCERLGYAMKRIRKSKGCDTLYVAKKLGYDDESTYCRMERGKIQNICIWTILKFCDLFECNIFHLFILADIDIFKTQIKTWTEFYKSLSNLSDNEVEKLNELAKHSPPLQ